MATVTLYLGQHRPTTADAWLNATDWCDAEAAVTQQLKQRAPAGQEYRVLAVAAEVIEPAPAGTVVSLAPATAVVGGPDVTVHVGGTGFTAASQILWNGSPEVTVYVSATELTTVVKPSLASGPVAVPVGVVGAVGEVPFTFTAAARR